MEFNKKLQSLRKRENMTQEQLSQKLYVSRTAISKWESDRGLPNIDALKNISKVFNVSIDYLLSSEEIIDIAQTENSYRQNRLISLIFAIYDFMIILFIFLPLYGEKRGDYIYSVNLFQLTTHPIIKTTYYIIFITICLLGLIEVVLHFFDNIKVQKVLRRLSLILHTFSVLIFTSTR